MKIRKPLRPTLANVFLCHYEKLWLESCPPEFKPVVYGRYVDDIFVLFESKNHLLLFAKYINIRHKNVKLHLVLNKILAFPF